MCLSVLNIQCRVFAWWKLFDAHVKEKVTVGRGGGEGVSKAWQVQVQSTSGKIYVRCIKAETSFKQSDGLTIETKTGRM